jgi:hypothetical protein
MSRLNLRCFGPSCARPGTFTVRSAALAGARGIVDDYDITCGVTTTDEIPVAVSRAPARRHRSRRDRPARSPAATTSSRRSAAPRAPRRSIRILIGRPRSCVVATGQPAELRIALVALGVAMALRRGHRR